MKNTLDVYTSFDYKGATYAPRMTLDMDALAVDVGDLSAIAVALASANHIDSYSYQYDILLDSPLYFDHATGLAEVFLAGVDFDFTGFLAAQQEAKIVQLLQKITDDELGISDLSAHAALQRVLLRVYYLTH